MIFEDHIVPGSVSKSKLNEAHRLLEDYHREVHPEGDDMCAACDALDTLRPDCASWAHVDDRCPFGLLCHWPGCSRMSAPAPPRRGLLSRLPVPHSGAVRVSVGGGVRLHLGPVTLEVFRVEPHVGGPPYVWTERGAFGRFGARRLWVRRVRARLGSVVFSAELWLRWPRRDRS